MRNSKFLIPVVLMSLVGVVHADDSEGMKLYKDKTCFTCHGDVGDKPLMPNYPKLAGQSKDYLVQQMKDIKSGARSNGQAAVMKPIVAGIDDADLEKIATYLAGLSPAAAK